MKKISVALLLFPGFQLLDIAGPRDAFAEVKVLSQGQAQYDVMTIGTTRNPIASSSGLTVLPDRTIFDACPGFDTIIVPGGLGVFEVMHDSTVSAWLRTHAPAARRLAAICNGAFAVGAAGFLKDRTVSTHWMDAAHLARAFPHCRVEPDRIYVKDGPLYTTAGVTAGIDLALAMVEEDHGRAMASAVAKYLIVYLRRSGGQSQFSPLLALQADDGSPVEALRRRLLDGLQQPHTLASLAREANMSPRHLSRVFLRDCGIAPMAFLQHARIDAARRLLEGTDLALKEIAARCGFDSPQGLRRAFVRSLQLTPPEYRRRFRSSDGGAELAA